MPSLEDRNDYPRFIAYDAAQQQIVGINESQTLTWDWTENKWVNANSEIHYIKGGDMAYDSSHQQMIFLAYSDSDLKPDLYCGMVKPGVWAQYSGRFSGGQ